MKRTNCVIGTIYGSTTMINIEPYSTIKDLIYNEFSNLITLIYEYDDFNTEKSKSVNIYISKNSFSDPGPLYTYWGTSKENKATLSTMNNNGGYGNSTNITFNVHNEVLYNYIFYYEIKPIEELRDNTINEIIS